MFSQCYLFLVSPVQNEGDHAGLCTCVLRHPSHRETAAAPFLVAASPLLPSGGRRCSFFGRPKECRARASVWCKSLCPTMQLQVLKESNRKKERARVHSLGSDRVLHRVQRRAWLAIRETGGFLDWLAVLRSTPVSLVL
jgi:hypothetical protein